jgi:hypothetical protein
MENGKQLKAFGNPMRKALKGIIERCDKAGIEYKWDDFGLGGQHFLVVYIQEGRNKRRIVVSDIKGAQRLLDLDFEKYAFVEGFLEAVCCYEEGWLEVVVDIIGPLRSKTWVLMRLTGRKWEEVEEDIRAGKVAGVELKEGGSKGVRVSIGEPSSTLLAMLRHVERARALSFRVEGLKIGTNAEAAEELGRVSNSVFFELRKKRNISLFVNRFYEVEAAPAWARPPTEKGKGESKLGFPKFEYDKEAMELYWHAVSAYKMPLLQYLGYYQVLEYYFPTYSMLGAKKEIRNCVKDPDFDVDDDRYVEKIVGCVSRQLGPHVSERELLYNTIQACISEEDLVSAVSGEPLKRYFKKEYKVVSQYRVSGDNEEKEVREQLAERIHNIRCRIVHTKEEDERGRIMPFTKEEALLQRFELPVIESLANKVLIANSKTLSFE